MFAAGRAAPKPLGGEGREPLPQKQNLLDDQAALSGMTRCSPFFSARIYYYRPRIMRALAGIRADAYPNRPAPDMKYPALAGYFISVLTIESNPDLLRPQECST
jgi:hypothetical protein